ncbi:MULTISPECIES: Uma2 family endonuclease [Streptomyces]|uniref:Uma2 family endonuclease n=1 Tax=Streptomyces silvae TaxID=2803812 RepID=A0ABU8A212_9ACTN|nr:MULTISPECIES: Uma2 family endonuclease [unclassified Streptomyces]WSS73429.1 Uma2 family endonuclease [Streptomyces sp. NBC_01175]WSS80970.1 Uma2 family endonuclease [Streptomyces sp. NBC_01174]MDX3328253.1 Uma2 family endonuclease [Streptomyces sp. ME02-6979-3A]MDX3433229.1 Uma2 family endonuclease [Streptomyces sp. ME01-18a]MDX3688093.1 Uma2 family endonuclease [Streptomyces sp. AK04-4c]
MTAEPITGQSSRWPVPPQDGYTVDDLFTLPDLPPHTELLDGSLIFVSPQRIFHSLMIDLLTSGLRGSVPRELKVVREMTVVLDRRNGPEPDVSVVRAESVTGREQTRFEAADVLLAVEVVSPDSEARDRETKPHKYAAAGIPNFWLVEMAGSDKHPVVRVYELDPVNKTYALTGIHHDRLKTGVPFPVDVDISPEALDAL